MEKAIGRDSVGASVTRGRISDEVLGRMKGVYEIEVIRDGKVIERRVEENLITTEGKRYILDVAMHGGNGTTYNAKTAFYVILSGSTTAADVGMTYDVQSFTEFIDYDETTRQTWTGVLDGSAASITNSAAKAVFTIAAPSANSGVVYGAGLCSKNTKSNHDSFATAKDVLVSFSKFGSEISVADNDVVNVTVTLSLS